MSTEHVAIADPNIHEPKGIAAASADKVYVADGAGSGDWTDISTLLAVTGLIFTGTGTPEGVQTANVGSIFLRTDGGAGTSIYVKESGTGNTGWVGK